MHNFLSILTLIFQFLFLLIFKLLSSLSESRVRLWNVWIKFYGWPHFVSLHHLRNQNSWIPGFCTCFSVSHKFDNFTIHCQSNASGYGIKACFIYQRKYLRFFGINILMGYHCVPSVKCYWSTMEVLRVYCQNFTWMIILSWIVMISFTIYAHWLATSTRYFIHVGPLGNISL